MEINNPAPIEPAIQTNVKSNPQNPIMPVTPTEGDSSNKMVLWLIGGVILIFLVVGVIYWYLSKQREANQPTFQPASVTIKPQPKDTVDALDRDLSALEDSNLDSDFSSLDQDLQNL
ncbi:hypothetical protein HY384_03870 [Candidatus Daviesbacteria bacterium]|nr:hypothetical protein [Candidatus Daviesbacteria bacterium]